MEDDKKKIKEALTHKAELLKTISHPVRLCILYMLLERQQRNVTDMQCCIDVSQPSVSQHIAKLKAAGIIAGSREGTEIYYRIKDEEVKKLLAEILRDTL